MFFVNRDKAVCHFYNTTQPNISQEDLKATEHSNNKLKYTCLECSYRTKAKSRMDDHVRSMHGQTLNKEINFICGSCKHEFCEEGNYNKHVKIHDEPKEAYTRILLLLKLKISWMIQMKKYSNQP